MTIHQLSVQSSKISYRSETNIPAAKIQKVMSKTIDSIIEIDPVRGTELVRVFGAWRKSEKLLVQNYTNYQNLEEYLEARIVDVAWP